MITALLGVQVYWGICFRLCTPQHDSTRSGVLSKLALIGLHRVHRSGIGLVFCLDYNHVLVCFVGAPERFVQPLWGGSTPDAKTGSGLGRREASPVG